MKKIALVAPAFAAVLMLVACNPSTITVPSDQTSSASAVMDTSKTVDAMPASAASMDKPKDAVDKPQDTAPKARVINMTVENWKFTPNAITLKKGEKVTMHLTGVSGIHGFASKDLGINVSIQAGETKDVDIPTDTTGTFSFRCSIPCGPGHRDMTGMIVVE